MSDGPAALCGAIVAILCLIGLFIIAPDDEETVTTQAIEQVAPEVKEPATEPIVEKDPYHVEFSENGRPIMNGEELDFREGFLSDDSGFFARHYLFFEWIVMTFLFGLGGGTIIVKVQNTTLSGSVTGYSTASIAAPFVGSGILYIGWLAIYYGLTRYFLNSYNIHAFYSAFGGLFDSLFGIFINNF